MNKVQIMVSSVGRKKKDADRVNYNISRSVRAAVLIEADKLGWNEIDTIEDLLRHGLAAKAMLKSGDINYADFVSRMDEIMKEAQADAQKDDRASAPNNDSPVDGNE